MGSVCLKKQKKQKILQAPASEEQPTSPHQPMRHRIKSASAKKKVALIKEAATAIEEDRIKSDSDRKMLMASFSKHFLLKNLSSSTKEHLLKKMRYLRMRALETVFEQDQPAQSFYVVDNGHLEVIVNGQRRHILQRGSSFGEFALLDSNARTATVKTLDKVAIWSLDRDTFRSAIQSLSHQDYEETLSFVNSVPLLENLTEDQKKTIAGSMHVQSWAFGETIVSEGDTGDLFYIVKEGRVTCTEMGKEVRQMGKGDYFGELALLYNTTRSATINSLADTIVLSISRQQFINALGEGLNGIIYKNTQRIIIQKSQHLKFLSEEQIEEVLRASEIRTFRQGEVVIPAGTPQNSRLYMVLRGSVKSNLDSDVLYGEDAIYNSSDDVYSEDLVAIGSTHVASLSKELLEEAIAGDLYHIVQFNELTKILEKIHLLRGLPFYKVREIAMRLKVQEFEDQEFIVKENEPGSSFYIVRSGLVEIRKHGTMLRHIPKYDFFGERSVLLEEIRSADAVSIGNTSCWVLSREDINEVLDESIKKQLLKRMDLQDDTIQLKDLVLVSYIGDCNHGHAYLTCHKDKRTLYSLRTLSKERIGEENDFVHVNQERQLLLNLDHPMIIKLVKSFRDQYRLYLLSEYVRGMELYDVLRILGGLREEDACFYTSCLIMIIGYLHEKGVMFRDLNTENVQVDDQGYPKLTDFAVAKVMSGRTYSIVGSPYYTAPEVILGSGHDFMVDWWSLGIMLYEFVEGFLPFGDEETDPQVVYEAILEHRLVLSGNTGANSLIQQLLSKNPESRIGGGLNKLKNHVWLSAVNWNSILLRTHKAPFIPKLNNLEDQIDVALKSSNDLEGSISRIEGQVEVKVKGPKNWDADF